MSSGSKGTEKFAILMNNTFCKDSPYSRLTKEVRKMLSNNELL